MLLAVLKANAFWKSNASACRVCFRKLLLLFAPLVPQVSENILFPSVVSIERLTEAPMGKGIFKTKLNLQPLSPRVGPNVPQQLEMHMEVLYGLGYQFNSQHRAWLDDTPPPPSWAIDSNYPMEI